MTFVLPVARRLTGVMILTLCAAWIGSVVIRQPSEIRFVTAACLGLAAVVVAMEWPRAAVVGTLILLPYLALGRRVLLEFTPWKSTDPLLLVAPTVLFVVLVRLFVIERRPVIDGRLSRLVVVLLGFILLEAFNPRGGGLSSGVGALLFTAVPVLWLFIGRELATTRSMKLLLVTLVLSACLIAVYGLNQSWNGLPSWDKMWVAQARYAALSVGTLIRAFGTFSSAAEYASFLSIAGVTSLAFALDRRPYLLPAIPLLAVALFYESSRGVIVTTVAAMIMVIAARTGSLRRATIVLIVLVAAVVLAVIFLRGTLQNASSSSNALVSHQAAGLLHPLNKKDSTLSTHLGMFQGGFERGVLDPIGQGIASTTLAGSKLGNTASSSTEVDFSNEFVALGTFGGLIYIAIVALALTAALRQAVERRDAVSLSVLGILVAVFGAWLNGGYYAVSPIVWFSVGYLVASRVQDRFRPDLRARG